MDEKLDTLYELCEVIDRELKEATEKVRKAGGKLSAGDVDYLDKLTHMLKSIKTSVAMMEEEEGGYSGNRYSYDGRSYGNNSYRGRSYEGRSYARGQRRDSRGRYSRDGYSYAEDIDSVVEEMRGMMDHLPEEKRREVQRFVDKMERM